MVNLFSFGCHVIDRAYVRVYRLYGWVGETIKRKGGVSQACLDKSTSFTLDIHNMVNWQLSKQDSHWPVSMTISRAHVSTYWGDVIYLEAVRWPVNYFTRSRSVSYFLASLGSEHRKTDTRQCCDPLTAVKTRYLLTSITWLYRGLRCRPIEVKYFWSYPLTSY